MLYLILTCILAGLVIAGLAYLFGGGMAIQVAVGRPLTYLEKVLITNLDVLPRPAGVRISQRVTYSTTSYFGFDGQINALSFGEEGQPSTGGQFAEEF